MAEKGVSGLFEGGGGKIVPSKKVLSCSNEKQHMDSLGDG